MNESDPLLATEPTITIVNRKEVFRKLFMDNPLRMETLRFRRRFINVTASPRMNQTLVGLVVLIYATILACVFAIRADVSVLTALFFQQVVVLLSAIVASHATIAGERDRRSWDLLQVAPVTQHQIVVGKFRGVLYLILTLQLALLPIVLIGQIFGVAHPNLGYMLLSEVLCLSSSSFCAAATIHLSSRLKSANATLVTSIASCVGIYAIVPLLMTVLASASASGSENTAVVNALYLLLSYWHPLYLLYVVGNYTLQLQANLLLPFLVSIGGYLGLTAGLLAWTGNRLTKRRRTE